jgi:hypothetical protein
LKDGPLQPLHALSYLRVISTFPTNGNQNNPAEHPVIGRECVRKTENLLVELATRISDILGEVVRNFILYDSQLLASNAAYSQLIKKADWKPPKGYQIPTLPGSESFYRKRATPDIDRLRKFERNAWQLCTVLTEFETIDIFDHRFSPREFLRDKLAGSLRKFLRKQTGLVDLTEDQQKKERNLSRPSMMERHISVYCTVISQVEHYVDLDIGEMIREILISEIWIPALGKSGNLDWITVEETDIKFEN